MNLIEVKGDKKSRVKKLFQDSNGGLLPDSILEGQIGVVLADNDVDPHFAVLELGDMPVCFMGGDATHPLARKYLSGLSRITQIFITTPDFIPVAHEVHPGKIVERKRWGFSAEDLDINKLIELQTKIPPEFTIKPLNLDIVNRLGERKNKFAELHGSTFESPEDFIEKGVGFCAFKDDQLACVGSSFIVCEKGIEIQIDTNPKFQGNGLATAVAAHLMVHCLENDLEPGWDAATPISAKLANKGPLHFTDTT